MSKDRIHNKRLNKYVIPLLSAFVMAVCLVFGIAYIRSFMERQTAAERTSQLDEMIAQIRVNLEYGLETHWNILEGIDETVEEKDYSNIEILTEEIKHLEKIFQLEAFGCRIMMIESTGTAYLSDGEAGIWDDMKYLSDGAKRTTFVSDTSNVEGA